MTHHTEAERPWWRDRTDEIEQQVGMGKMDAMACYTQMVQLLDADRRAPAAPVSKPELEAALDAMDDEVTRMQPGRSVRWIGFTRDDRLRVVAAALAAAPQPPEVVQSNSAEFDGIKTRAAPVQILIPFALYDGNRWFADEESAICACADLAKLQKVYLEQQVRQLLAAQEQTPLTIDEIGTCWQQMGNGFDKYEKFARAIERAHGIGAPPMGSDGNSTHS